MWMTSYRLAFSVQKLAGSVNSCLPSLLFSVTCLWPSAYFFLLYTLLSAANDSDVIKLYDLTSICQQVWLVLSVAIWDLSLIAKLKRWMGIPFLTHQLVLHRIYQLGFFNLIDHDEQEFQFQWRKKIISFLLELLVTCAISIFLTT